MTAAPYETGLGAPARRRFLRDEGAMRLVLGVVVITLTTGILLPLGALFALALEDRDGKFVGLANIARFLETPSLVSSIGNSLFVASLTTLITLPLAFGFAYALTRTCVRFRGFFNAVSAVPLLAPSLLPAIALIYLFGNQGLLRDFLGIESIYGPWGIIAAHVFFTFPQALVVLIAALSLADSRLYEAAAALGTPARRVFFTITLPGARYGLIGATFVVFTKVVTDFGVAKVIGGQYSVLATDIYKQVVGQQNFPMGATAGLLLLVPAISAFLVDRYVRRRQVAMLTARAVPLIPRPQPRRDWIAFGFCALIALLILGILGMAAWASLVTYWPYNLTLSLRHYDFAEVDPAGWQSFFNTLKLGFWVATIGTPLVFLSAYLMDRAPNVPRLAGYARFAAVLPLAVPGLAMGLAYIFFFNAPWNPLNFLYGGFAILVLNTVMRQWPVCHITATTTLTAIDREFESVSASLKVSVWRTLRRVLVPISLPTILDIWIYFFVNAATTLSAVIFLYVTDTKPASVAIVNMDEAGFTASAAAMAMMIVMACLVVKAAQVLISRLIDRRTQGWRRRDSAEA